MGPSTLDDALREFDIKYRDKTGHMWVNRGDPPKKGKYTLLQKIYEDQEEEDDEDDSQVNTKGTKKEIGESTLPPETQDLMELIFDEKYFASVLRQIGYDSHKLPLGQLGKQTINKGFVYLQELSELIEQPDLAITLGMSYDEVSISHLPLNAYLASYLIHVSAYRKSLFKPIVQLPNPSSYGAGSKVFADL